MDLNRDQSLISIPPRDLLAPPVSANRVVSELMVNSLAVAKEAVSTNVDLDALVREAKRIQRRHGMTPEDIRAFNMFHQAAVAGHPEGQYHVSDCYKLGLGAQKDHAACLKWLRKSVESGFGIEDVTLATIWRDAACGFEAEDMASYYKLLRTALEQRRDYLEMKNAAEEGHLESLEQFARLFYAIFDFDEAVIWYRRAAERGSAEGQYFVGQCYHVGADGDTEIDLRYACAWYQLAADQRYAMAIGMAHKLAKVLTPEELTSARAIYREMKQRFGGRGER